MKWRIMRHFIWVFTVCQSDSLGVGSSDFQWDNGIQFECFTFHIQVHFKEMCWVLGIKVVCEYVIISILLPLCSIFCLLSGIFDIGYLGKLNMGIFASLHQGILVNP